MIKEPSGRDGDKATQSIREWILRLELRPGLVLDEVSLATRLNVSRTPIREAIIQLISEGLVVRDGRKAKVAPLDFDEVPKLFDALLISSRMIHRLSAENRTEDNLERIHASMMQFEEHLTSDDGVQRSERNARFHLEISAAANNKYFSEFYESALLGTIRLVRACFSEREARHISQGTLEEDFKSHLQETAHQHRMMEEAIRARDIELSDRMATEHYELTRHRVEKILFRRLDSLSGGLDLKIRQ